jgi:alkyl hydroperoxide reductase subunit F
LKVKTIIVATGARWREYDVQGEREFKSKGVTYCAPCEILISKIKTLQL